MGQPCITKLIYLNENSTIIRSCVPLLKGKVTKRIIQVHTIHIYRNEIYLIDENSTILRSCVPLHEGKITDIIIQNHTTIHSYIYWCICGYQKLGTNVTLKMLESGVATKIAENEEWV